MVELNFEKQGGLVPVIIQDHKTKEVLMMAYTDITAWKLTLKTGLVHFWSRSRKKIWKKGEESGYIQEVKEIRVDCDEDSILIKVKQVKGAACHKGYRSCFYRVMQNNKLKNDGEKIFDPKEIYKDPEE